MNVMKRKNKTLAVSLSYLLAAFIFFMNSVITAYAVEDENETLSYNSVLEVESYEVEGGYIQTGKENTINLTIKNANTYSSANNLVAIITSASGMIFPAYGNDNQFYVGTLQGGASKTISVPVVTTSQLLEDYVDLTCQLVYETGGRQITNTSTMVLPTQNISALAVNSLDVSTRALLNGKSLLSISYSNNSSENVNDAVIFVDGNISEDTREIDLGNLVAGKSYTKDYNIIFTQAGEQVITVYIKYTNADGEYVENEIGSFKVNVDNENVSEFNVQTANPMLDMIGKIIAIGAIMVAAIAALIFLKKNHFI